MLTACEIDRILNHGVQMCSACNKKPVAMIDYNHWAVYVCGRCSLKKENSLKRKAKWLSNAVSSP